MTPEFPESQAREILERIEQAIAIADGVLKGYTPGAIEAQRKAGGDPVTEADLAVDAVLRRTLLRDGEGWLSEETADRPDRLRARRVWVVDPIDGTREFVQGIPEWCVSIGYIVDGEAVAGGIHNRVAGQTVLGSLTTGVRLNGSPVRAKDASRLAGSVVLASRSEVNRGEWERFRGAPFTVRPCGSVAWKLGQVASGQAEATWTLVPKNEWDVAAGTALVRAAGGEVRTRDWGHPRFNREKTLLEGLIACGAALIAEIGDYLGLSAR